KAQDQAQLIAAQKDLDRFKTLVAKAAETQQNVDQQQAKVDQFKATIDADQAAIESAQTQLSYATITAPIDGRVGFRQVDAGNIVHADDPNPLAVLTQIRPVVATFTLPQKNLADVREAMLRRPVDVLAFDQGSIEATTVDSDTAIVSKGVAAGERVVINGQYRLQSGTRVDATAEEAWRAPGKAS